RLPSIYQFREYAVAGGLLSYGVSITDAYRNCGRLYREDSQRRKTRRSTGAAADQVRDGNQSQDRRGARHQNLRQSTLARRRGDRIGPCCDCSQPLMALSGHSATICFLSAFEPKRTYAIV